MNWRRKNDETHEMGCGRDETDDLKGLKKPRVKEVKGVKAGVWKESGVPAASPYSNRGPDGAEVEAPVRSGDSDGGRLREQGRRRRQRSRRAGGP